MRTKLLAMVVTVVGAVALAGCDSSTQYHTTIEGTALPVFEKGTAVTLFLKAEAAGTGQMSTFSGRVAGQSQGWLILDTDTDRQVIAASAIARLSLAKPTSGSKPPPAGAPALPDTPATPQTSGAPSGDAP